MARQLFHRAVAWLALAAALLVTTGGAEPTAQQASPPAEALSRWRYVKQIHVPAGASRYVAFLVDEELFTHARPDLGDLRIFAASGREVPYALRVLRERRDVMRLLGEIVNRGTTEEGARRVDVRLSDPATVHSELALDLGGGTFRRRVIVSGSDDGTDWVKLAESWVYQIPDIGFTRLTVRYPRSTFRWLRVEVHPDPIFDKEPPPIRGVAVRYRREVPGRYVVYRAEVSDRQPTRAEGQFASAWVVRLKGRNIPVNGVELDAADRDFVRDVIVYGSNDPELTDGWKTLASSRWRRKLTQKPAPLRISLGETRLALLRVVIIDHRNPPLTLTRVQVHGPAHQVVMPAADVEPSMRVFFGNASALPPRYDFAFNLPDRLDPPPRHAKLGPLQPNPTYTPPLTELPERYPWLPYAVLALPTVVLLTTLIDTVRRLLAAERRRAHDRE